MSAIASQISSMIGQTTSQLGQPVTYTPDGGIPSQPFLAVVEEVDSTQLMTGSQLDITAERRNFLVQVSDLGVIPRRGDTIAYDGVTYTVMLFSDKKAVWEWSDKFNVRRRIFTKRTA